MCRQRPAESGHRPTGRALFRLNIPLAGIVDRSKETARVERSLEKLVKQRGALQAKLANPAFVSRADPAVVRQTQTQEEAIGQHQEKLEHILRELDR